MRDQARTRSLDPVFIGPYKVISRNGANVLIKESRSGKGKWVHLNRCKLFRSFVGIVPALATSEGPQTRQCASDTELSSVGEEDDLNSSYVEEQQNREPDYENELSNDGSVESCSRYGRSRKKTKFFGEPIPWDTMKIMSAIRK